MKADKAKALEMLNKGEGGFRYRDPYVVGNYSTGKIVAQGNPNRQNMLSQDADHEGQHRQGFRRGNLRRGPEAGDLRLKGMSRGLRTSMYPYVALRSPTYRKKFTR